MDSVTAAHPALRGLRETLYDNARLVNTALRTHVYYTDYSTIILYTYCTYNIHVCICVITVAIITVRKESYGVK